MPPTQKEIAASLGVSQALVANVLNDKPGVWASAETRARIAAAARQLGYRPNRSARALVTGQTRTIVFWSPFLTTPYYASVLAAFSYLVTAAGYHLLIRLSGDPVATLEEFGSTSACDGIVAVDVMHGGRELSEAVMKIRVPIVLLGVHSPELAVDRVHVDLAPGVREGVQRLCGSGRRRIAYLVSRGMCHPGEVRYREYVAVIRQQSCEPEIIPFDGEDRAASGPALREHIASHGLPEAVFCQNDDIAMGAYRALRDLKARIPQDMALMGCDGTDQMAYFDPPISSIVIPVNAMCSRAWAFLAQRMADPELPRQEAVLPAPFVARGSTAGKKST